MGSFTELPVPHAKSVSATSAAFDADHAATNPTVAADADTAIERARLRVVLATIMLNVAAVALLTLAPEAAWHSGLAVALADDALLLGFVVMYRDRFMARLVVFGLAVGFAELAADAWLVNATGTLDYSIAGGPMLWESPVWMPLAWGAVAVQTGYVGIRLSERFGGPGVLLTGVLAAVYIPYYEEMARHIQWWTYDGCRMISNTPYYIILGEFGIAIALVLLARPLRHRGAASAVGLGLLGGAAILVCYALAHAAIDGSVPV